MKKFLKDFDVWWIAGMLSVTTPIILLLAGFLGWGMNVYKLTQLDFQTPYKAEVIRTAGVFSPIGAIVGYITFEEETK
jgi:hypothetical protein